MILSSTSVILRTNVTFIPEASNQRRTTSNATNVRP
ncbi:hypothetical protein EVA_06217 [gut metagenome]|uniref:Uncharacterized protein n=1 Tax=gut metagenome TaxID=749906 RepID=J9GSP2_9ZZZZ